MGLFSRTLDVQKVFADEVAKLAQLGYHSFQVRDIIDEVLNGRKVKKLTEQEEEQIRQRLLQQIQFAKDALAKGSSKRAR